MDLHLIVKRNQMKQKYNPVISWAGQSQVSAGVSVLRNTLSLPPWRTSQDKTYVYVTRNLTELDEVRYQGPVAEFNPVKKSIGQTYWSGGNRKESINISWKRNVDAASGRFLIRYLAIQLDHPKGGAINCLSMSLILVARKKRDQKKEISGQGANPRGAWKRENAIGSHHAMTHDDIHTIQLPAHQSTTKVYLQGARSIWTFVYLVVTWHRIDQLSQSQLSD